VKIEDLQEDLHGSKGLDFPTTLEILSAEPEISFRVQ